MAAQEERPWEELVTHDGLFVVDSRQRVVHWSDSAQRVLGRSAREALGMYCYDVIGGREDSSYRFCRKNCPVMVNARRGRATPDYDILCELPGGARRWLNVSVAVVRDGGSTTRVLHLVRDVSRRKETEEFARKVASALESFVGQWREEGSQEPPGSAAPAPGPRLSRREREVLGLLAAGMTTRQIAESLGVSHVTARNHVSRVLTRLGVTSRLQAVVYATERGLL